MDINPLEIIIKTHSYKPLLNDRNLDMAYLKMSCNLSCGSLVLNFQECCTRYSVLQIYNEITSAQNNIGSVYIYIEIGKVLPYFI